MILLDNYKLTEKIYTDYQNSTYFRAVNQLTKNPVIIKFTYIKNSKIKHWLKNEYQILQNINLSGIVKTHSLQDDKNDPILILENFHGKFLAQHLDTKVFTIKEFLAIAISLLETLQNLHQNKIIHQNINPSSIIIDPEGFDVKITNFSIATISTRETKTSTTQLEASNIAYISPEQTGRTNHSFDYRTDFYSLGIVFYQMLTGELPCDHQESLQVIHCHLAQTPIAPHQIDSQIPQTVSSIVMKLLAKNPDDRYQSAYGIKSDLEICQTQYQNQGKIEPFDLGAFDKHSNFIISPKLYGRTTEINTLKSSLERVYSGATEIVLVSGQLGIGKTSLVQEITRSLIKQKSFSIRGKFEPSHTNIPYGGIIEAFNGLIRYLLTQNAYSRQIWREKILLAVGNNGKVITDLLPELELIIGSQPNVPKLPAKETENRFNIVFVEFVRTFIDEEHPLVFFLDDLQWADSASLNLLALLLDNLNSQYLLIIWVYRDEDFDKVTSEKNQAFSDFVNFTDLITSAVEKTAQNIVVNQIVLQSLKLNDINQLLVDTLLCQESESLLLAELLSERTQGNPLLVKQLLQTFYDEEFITFDFHKRCWQWNLEEISSAPICDYSILELVTKNLEKLSERSQQILKVAACISHKFDLQTVAFACDENEDKIAQELEPALKAGIIFIVKKQPNSVYKFLHNRIQQTTYSLLTETEKNSIHLKIGQFILQNTKPDKISLKIFDLVHHLNRGRNLLGEGFLKNRVAELNLIAGKKAKKAIAYEVAANYLQIALELLPSSTWKDNYNLISDVYIEAIEVQYLQTNFDRAETLANIAISLSKTVLEKARIYQIKIHAYIARNQMQLAIDNGLAILELLNVFLSDNPTQNSDLALRLSKADCLQSLENLPRMTNESIVAAMEILGIVIPAIYIVKPQLFPSVVLKMIDLCLQYGTCKHSAFAYALYGLLLCAQGDIDHGYQLGKLALTIQEQFDAIEIKSKVDFIFNNTILHWREPAIHTIGYFLEGIKDGIEAGDIEHACFHAKYYCTYLLFIGEPLPSAAEKSQKQIYMIQNFKQDFQLNYARIWQQLNFNLQGLAEKQLLLIGKSFDESKVLHIWQSTNNATSLFAFYLAKLILCYFLQDYQQAIVNADRGKQYLNAAVGTMCFSMYHFYASLAKLAVCSPKIEIPSEYLSEIATYRKQLKHWADYAPDNYLNKYRLVTAEIARVLGKKERAAENYDRAITIAAKAGYIHEASLAEELAGEFYLSQGRTRIAGYYLNDAYSGYLRWGASAKAQALESKYSQLLTRIPTQELTTTTTNIHQVEVPDQSPSLANLDLFTVIKASQAISSEIILDNLLSKMMEIVMENAGSQKTILLLQQNSSWIVAASATINSAMKVELPYLPIAEYLKLPNSIINYIQSTRKTVILEQASQESLFTDDPYIRKNQPKSVLACPMIYQNELQGIIYLENNLVEGAFTQQKLDILQVLLSQVSISIENARLYKNLKDHASVKKSLKQKEILLKEIHHRVKNNLLVVSSLLDFQSNYTDDTKVLKLLENCQNRITSMALVHQHLYGNSELDKINFAQYLESLLDNLAYSQASQERNINFILDLDRIDLNIETANPCGLIVNELVSNALEHGFGDRASSEILHDSNYGNIWLSLKQNLEGKIALTIQDDGVGFPEDIDLYNSDSLGLELVCTLVEQIDGTIELDRTSGTKIEIFFQELNYQSRI